ncbi:MAG: hypothetical protein MJE77_45325 [Proteobacteria bacterium]|nr:hypothetical protein [Pseudomonadota bacterium]
MNRANYLGFGLIVGLAAMGGAVMAKTPEGGGDGGKSGEAKRHGPAKKPAIDPEAREAARRDFADIAAVLLSPRCRNCHPAGDRPLQRDDGVPHRMNISRRSPEAGLECTACHRERNAPFAGGPPGVPDWHMPSKELPMVFEGRGPRALCEQLNDPDRTGGRSPGDLVEHVRHDRLVAWAWQPGAGRSKPPIPFDAFVKAVERWAAAGAPCPHE